MIMGQIEKVLSKKKMPTDEGNNRMDEKKNTKGQIDKDLGQNKKKPYDERKNRMGK